MSSLQHKIDFAVVLRVKHANPNGDPLNGNRPRIDYNGNGEISDVCLKRKLRDRLMEAGQKIFVQSDDRKNDDAKSLRDRAEKALSGKFGSADTARLANETWFDVRTFGQLFALPKKSKSKGDDENGDTGISIPIRGPVTVQSAFSLKPVDVTSTQITKSVSGEGDGSKRGSDTMGMKHRVDDAVYVFYGSMNPQLAERTGFSDEDAEAIKAVLPKLFENDASSARPEGSMEVLKVLWWKQSKPGKYSSAKVHALLHMNEDGSGGYNLGKLDGLTTEEIPGF
ncbi:MAG: type I-C CRISPR-associated protein Cas7/Csd2 [Terracidiphilus sp.]